MRSMLCHTSLHMHYFSIFTVCVEERLNSTASVSDGGTMYQLRNLINRQNDTNDPSHNVDASEDFFLTIVEAYILNAATDLYQMKSLSDHPVDPSLFSNTDCNNPSEILIKASEKVVSRFVDIFENMNKYCKTDGVHCYTCEAISLGLL